MPKAVNRNNYGDNTFEYFFSKLINNFSFLSTSVDYNSLQTKLIDDSDLIFLRFTSDFEKFDLNYLSIY
jgi:hypothetical protein